MHGRRHGAILILLLVAQMLLMTGSARKSSRAARVERFVVGLSAPVVRISHWAGGRVSGGLRSVEELFAARSTNAALRADLRQLRGELRRSREAEAQNERLRGLLEMREELAPQSIVATVVTANADPAARVVVLDRGSADGVREDQAVVAWGGAVGRVVSVAPRESKVRLLSDPNSGVGGVVQRSRERGIVFGRSDRRLELRYVSRFADVVHGDRVVTSGADGIFPRGFGVGTVTSIRRVPDGTQTIELRPEVRFGRLEEVLIVLESAPEEPSP